MAKKDRRAQLEFDQMLLSDSSPFVVNEAFKTLRTNINFALPDAGAKVIGITSTNRGEGKSSVSINIAISFATVGKKVLLIDCDMRLPSVAKRLNINGRPGLSDFLIGSAEFSECKRSVMDGLIDVLPAGSIPADPTGLLESESILGLISRMKQHYDCIIMDFPPVNTVTDAAIMSKVIDGFLLVIRHNSTEYKQAKLMKKALQLANARIIGFVYNDAPVNDKGKYGYYR